MAEGERREITGVGAVRSVHSPALMLTVICGAVEPKSEKNHAV